MAALAFGAATATAQPDFYHVYQYETPLAGWAEPAYWTSYVPQSAETLRSFGVDRPREGLWAHSLEFEFGASDHLSLAAYGDFEDPTGGSPHFTQGRFEARYRFAQAYEHFVDTGVVAEFYLPRHGSPDPQQLEFRGVVQKDIGDFRLVLNPALGFDTMGRNAGRSPDAQLESAIYYRRGRIAQPGVEFYADFGRAGRWDNQRYVAMPVVDVLIGRNWWWHLGAGRRVGGHGDAWVVESMVRLEFNMVRPSRWFGSR